MSDKSNLGEIILPNETKHQIYLDAAQPTVQEVGKFLGRIPRAINAAFAPLDIWIESRQHNIAMTKKLMEQNLENVNPEKIVPPEPYVAVPAIQALSYSMDSEELRKLYANLLAKSLYTDTKDSVHPAFTEIIKNLSPLDCRVFEAILKKGAKQIPCFELRLGKTENSSYVTLFPYITEFTFDTVDNIAMSINNLERNRLITCSDFRYTDDSKYEVIRQTEIFQSLQDGINDAVPGKKMFAHKSSIHATNLGKEFYKVCCIPL